MRPRALLARMALGVACLVVAVAACNSGAADCPAQASVQPGAPCTDDNVQCAYSLSSPSPACDGTTTTLASSCVCVDKTWSCPSPVDCGGDASTADAAEADAGIDSGLTTDAPAEDSRAGEDSSKDSGTHEGGSADAGRDG